MLYGPSIRTSASGRVAESVLLRKIDGAKYAFQLVRNVDDPQRAQAVAARGSATSR